MKEAPVLAIVVPCYKEEAVLHETHKRLSQLLDRLATKERISPKSYILYVNDGSTDRTWEIIKEFYKKYVVCLRAEPGWKCGASKRTYGRTECCKGTLRCSYFH